MRDDHWLHNATHANGLARRLCEGLGALPGVRFAWPVEANEVFPIIPKSLDKALRAAGAAYHAWTSGSLPEDEAVGPDEAMIRLVLSFANEESQVERFLETARSALRPQAAE